MSADQDQQIDAGSRRSRTEFSPDFPKVLITK